MTDVPFTRVTVHAADTPLQLRLLKPYPQTSIQHVQSQLPCKQACTLCMVHNPILAYLPSLPNPQPCPAPPAPITTPALLHMRASGGAPRGHAALLPARGGCVEQRPGRGLLTGLVRVHADYCHEPAAGRQVFGGAEGAAGSSGSGSGLQQWTGRLRWARRCVWRHHVASSSLRLQWLCMQIQAQALSGYNVSSLSANMKGEYYNSCSSRRLRSCCHDS